MKKLVLDEKTIGKPYETIYRICLYDCKRDFL